MNKKENTLRMLAEKPILITSVWCYLGIHNWTQWRDDVADSEYSFSTRHYQSKTCAHCNKRIRRNTDD